MLDLTKAELDKALLDELTEPERTEENMGWFRDVISRFWREGKLTAGDISAKAVIPVLLRYGLIIELHGGNYDYQLTNAGFRYIVNDDDIDRSKIRVKVGDTITVNPDDYENGESIYTVAEIDSTGEQLRVIPKMTTDFDDGEIVVNIHEIFHCTYEEDDEGLRKYYA